MAKESLTVVRERLAEFLPRLSERVEADGQAGLNNIHKLSEPVIRNLMNILYGLELEQEKKVNAGGFDLRDSGHHVLVQVTGNCTDQKIKDCLRTTADRVAKEAELADSELFIVFLTTQSKEIEKLRKKTVAKLKKDELKAEGFRFSPESGILCLQDFVQYLTDDLGPDGEELTEKQIRKIQNLLDKHSPEADRAAPLLNLPLPGGMAKAEFVGRQAELAELSGKLEADDNPIYISGLGGMGKTALVTRFCAGYRGGNVYFVRFRESFTQTVMMEVAAGIPGCKNRQADPDRDYAEAMELLSQCPRGDILVIDNVDGPNDDLGALQMDHTWPQLKSLKLRLILTTRCDQTGAVRVRKMENETLHRFFENQELSLEKARMDALIDAVHGHTMTVDLMARTLRRSRTLTAEKLLEVLGGGGLKDPKFRPVALTRNGKVEQEVIYEHLRRLFNVAEVSEEARAVLRNMVLLPEGGMDINILEVVLPSFKRGVLKRIKSMFSGEESKTPGMVINDLIDHGWLSFDGKSCFVTIHPVVRLVCREELKPDDENCGPFLEAVWDYYDPNQYSAEAFKQYAELFSQAAEILPDTQGEWAIHAGIFWRALGQPGNALRQEESAVGRLEISQPDSRKLATACNNLGITYGALGDHKKALEFKLKALEIREKVLPRLHPDLAIFYNNVGGTYGALGDHKKALEYQLKSLEIREKVLPRLHPDLAISYNNVGFTYGALGDHEKALEYQMKALEIREKVLPRWHPDLATSYNNVGFTYGDLGDHKKALEFNLKSLEIREKVLPRWHPDLATSYNNVGLTYGDLGDHKKALEYQMKALEICEKVLPPAHPLIAASCFNLMFEYYRQGDYETALRYGQRAVSIAEQSLPEGHPDRELYKQNLEALKTYL